jgi:predicted CoA-binding protein
MNSKTIAVLGASADRSKFSNKAVRAYVQEGWEVYPVNPKGGTIEGLQACTSLAEIPGMWTGVTVYLPPPVAVKALADIAKIEPDEVYINPGAESADLIAEAEKLGIDPILAVQHCRYRRESVGFPRMKLNHEGTKDRKKQLGLLESFGLVREEVLDRKGSSSHPMIQSTTNYTS